jgi:hypothetical protein
MKLTGQKKHLDITVDVCAGVPFPCPVCGGKTVMVSEREESWLHENFFSLCTCITATLPLVRCDKCGEQLVRAPWEQPGSRFRSLSEGAGNDLPPPASDETGG